MALGIAHPRGCRYYLGDFKDEQYLPDFHAHMNFAKDGPRQGYFSPETVLTPDGRRVVWTWIRDMPLNPEGVQALPRELELPEDGVLRMKPLRELVKLRFDQKQESKITIKGGGSYYLKELNGDALELEIKFAAPLPEEFGLNLLGNEKDGSGAMSIITGAEKKLLAVGNLNAPFQLREGESLSLRVFIDKNLVEVFANDRQAVSYVHVPVIRKNPNISLFARGGDLKVTKVTAWKMKSIYAKAEQPSERVK
jgi:beta-fructofuranosidase